MVWQEKSTFKCYYDLLNLHFYNADTSKKKLGKEIPLKKSLLQTNIYSDKQNEPTNLVSIKSEGCEEKTCFEICFKNMAEKVSKIDPLPLTGVTSLTDRNLGITLKNIIAIA